MKELGEKLRELREEAELSMKQAATAVEASDAAVCKWENGLAEPKASFIIKLAKFYNVTADWLLGLDGDFETDTKHAGTTAAVSPDERRILAAYRSLSPELKTLATITLETWGK